MTNQPAPKGAAIRLTKSGLYKRLASDLAKVYPTHYATKDGSPNFFHILGSALKCGFAEVNDDNLESVFEAIAARAAGKAHEPPADDAPTTPPPPDDEALTWPAGDPEPLAQPTQNRITPPAAPTTPAKPAPKTVQAAKIERREWPNLAAALAAAQGLIVAAEKNRENPFFKSRYATLESVWDACRDALSSNGLAVIQIPVNGEERGQVGVTTILCHASGEQVSGTIYAKAMKDDAQGYGSVITYLRRYSLAAFVGVTSEEDDDGNAATQQGKPQQRK